MNSKGNIVWEKSLGGSEGESAFSVQQTADGGYIVTGITNSNDGDVSHNFGGTDGWVVKLNGSGKIEWQKTFGGSKREWINNIRQTTDGGYIFTGFTESNDGNLSGISGRRSNRNIWLVKLNANGEIVCQKLFGGSKADNGKAIQQTKDGGYIVAASSSSNGDVLINRGGQDFWIIKFTCFPLYSCLMFPLSVKRSIFK